MDEFINQFRAPWQVWKSRWATEGANRMVANDPVQKSQRFQVENGAYLTASNRAYYSAVAFNKPVCYNHTDTS